MKRFLKLTVRGFRRLADVELDLRPLTVLIGANGVGKSSFLDAFSLLARSAQGGLLSAVGEMSGIGAMLTIGRADRIIFDISSNLANRETLGYALTLRPRGAGYVVEKETLRHHLADGNTFFHIDSRESDVLYLQPSDGKFVRPSWEHNPVETSLSQVPKTFREPEEFRQRLASLTFYHLLDVEPRSPARLPQPMRPALLPGKNGEDLVSCLFNLRETDRDRFDAIEDALRAAFPGFERMDFPPVAAGTLAMTWRDKDFSAPLYMHQVSEGMLRFLWLATLLQCPGLTALTLLDEPEVSLHPELLSLLAGLLREAAHRTQILVATHSDRLIRFLRPDEVVVMDSAGDGTSTLTWADKLNLDQWLEEYALDELWRSGRLGARG
jgi:predicted ATPase